MAVFGHELKTDELSLGHEKDEVQKFQASRLKRVNGFLTLCIKKLRKRELKRSE